jgi:hypothetical protein
MLGGGEDFGGVVDAHGLVARRMQDQKRLLHIADPVCQTDGVEILDELALYGEAASTQLDFGSTFFSDFVDM